MQETIVSGLISEAASGILATAFNLQLEHELQRNVLLKATAGYINQDFESTTRTDNMFNASFGMRYLLNRTWSLNADYLFSYRDTNALRQDFKRHSLMLGLSASW